jgi:NAD(P)-dependent dehydrogenase (short-subunit alcohol dehydrogenase family)
LAREGWSLLLAGRSEAKLIGTRDICIAALLRRSVLDDGQSARPAGSDFSPPCFEIFPADLSTANPNQRLISSCVSTFGGLDALINNAGLAEALSIAATSPAVIDRIFATNTLGPAYAIHYAWPHLVASGRAGNRPCVINVSSIATVDPFPGFFAYGSSKAALNLMIQSCAKEGAEHGIRAFAIAPGAVETPMLRSAFDEQAIPRDHTLEPEGVATVIAACLHSDYDASNGRMIPVLPKGGGAKAWYEAYIKAHPPLPPV